MAAVVESGKDASKRKMHLFRLLSGETSNVGAKETTEEESLPGSRRDSEASEQKCRSPEGTPVISTPASPNVSLLGSRNHARKKSTLMEQASQHKRRLSSRLGSMFRALSFASGLGGLQSPVDEFTLVDFGLEYIPVSPEFCKEEVYVVVVEHEVTNFAEEKVMQRDFHCLGLTVEQLAKVAEPASRLAAHMKEADGMPQMMHAELMGRESQQFEVLFGVYSNWLIYVDGRASCGFGRLEGSTEKNPRLLQLSNPSKNALQSLSRAWQVPFTAEQLDPLNAFVLDTRFGTVYFWQKKASPQQSMGATILAPLLGADKTSSPDEKFWKALGCASGKDESASMMRATVSTDHGSKPEHSESQIWVAESVNPAKFDMVASKKINQTYLSKRGTDKVYVVVGAREMFIYSQYTKAIDFEGALRLSAEFSRERRWSKNSSFSLVQMETDAVNETFDALFPY